MSSIKRLMSVRWIRYLLLAIIATTILLTVLNLGISRPAQAILTDQVPDNPNATDNTSYELGMKFQSTVPGYITMLRHYKAVDETNAPASHTGKIWDANGNLLASVTFANETMEQGWQEQVLPNPLPIEANTTYVVSVNVNSHYPFTNSGLATQIVNGDLRTVADGQNGVFGSAGQFPIQSFNSSNYFRDIKFMPVTDGPTKPAKKASES